MKKSKLSKFKGTSVIFKRTSVIIVGIISIVIIVISFSIGVYKINRWFNWNTDYQVRVEETVRDMVKSECLKGK